MNNFKNKIEGSFFSSTMWFGFLIMAATWLENNTQMLSGLVDSQYSALIGYGIGLAIWFLRWITTRPVQDKKPQKEIIIEKKKPTISKKRWDDELAKSNNLDSF